MFVFVFLISQIFRHGDIVYVSYVEPQEPQHDLVNNDSAEIRPNNVKQDEVDDFLEKQRGLIDRKKDPKL